MTKNPAKSSRVTNVQVPGEQQPAVEHQTAAAAPAPTPTPAPANEQPAAQHEAVAKGVDIEALRDQIRAEERDKARRELGQQIEAAASVVAKSDGPAAGQRSKADYRTMRAADVDPTTLIAPVLTLDGYVCPPAPDAKK